MFFFFSELFAGHHGPPVSRDGPIGPEQNESSEFVDLLRPGPHAWLQPGPARGQQHLWADPNPEVLDRNLAKKPKRIVRSESQWKQLLKNETKNWDVLEPKQNKMFNKKKLKVEIEGCRYCFSLSAQVLLVYLVWFPEKIIKAKNFDI